MKQFLKQAVLQGAELSGLNRFYRWKTKNRLLGLCYHGVIGDEAPWDDPRTRIAVSASQFERQMQELRTNWKPVSLSALDDFFRTGRPIPDRSVFVGFDDGFRNNLTIAAPILRRHEIPATVFLATGLIGTEYTIWPLELLERIIQWTGGRLPVPRSVFDGTLPDNPSVRKNAATEIVNRCKGLTDAECREIVEKFRQEGGFRRELRWQEELYRMLDWDEARLLLEQGIEIGAHTVTHCNLARVAQTVVEKELRQSKEEIESRLGIECFSVAYPFGDPGAFSDSVIEVVRNLGFRIGVTLCLRKNPVEPAPLRLDRLCITGDLNLASFRSLLAGWRT